MNPLHEKNLGHLCARTARAFRAHMERRTQEIGLPFSQAIVLMYLHHHNSSSLAEMARDLCFAHPSVLRQVDALEEAGYVERKPHPEDRRVKVIELTATGKAQVELLIEIAEDIQRQVTVGFKSDEIKELRESLQKLIRNLHDMQTSNN